MSLVQSLIAIIAAAVGYGIFQKSKRNSAEAINTNVATKEEIQKLQSAIDKGDANIAAEETKRKELEGKINETKTVDLTTLLDFFTKR